jgi:hypothetical protein
MDKTLPNPLIHLPNMPFKNRQVPVAPAVAALQEKSLFQSLALALETAPQVIDHLVDRSIWRMKCEAQIQADPAQRAWLHDCAVAMNKQRPSWGQHFAASLCTAFAHPCEQDSRLPNADLRVCAQEAAQLEALVMTAGSKRGNPMRPASYIRALRDLVSSTQTSAQQQQVWIDFLLAALGTQLAWVYLQLAASFRSPSDEKTSDVDDDQEFAAYATHVYGLDQGIDEALPPQMWPLAQEAHETVKRLRALLGRPEPAVWTQSDATTSKMMQSIEESEQLLRELTTQGPPQTGPDPDQDAQSHEQHTLSRRVEKLIDGYANAITPELKQVPMAVREALKKLQLPLQRLASSDPSLFAEPDHPARLLLAGITQRSQRFASEEADGFRTFFRPVKKMLEAVGRVAQPSAKVYAQALARLGPVWKQLEREIEEIERDKADRLAHMEARRQLAVRLGFELVSRRDANDAPVSVKQFLMGPWAQVLARAQLQPLHPQDEQRYQHTVALLVWSVSLRRAGRFKSKLVESIPELRHALQAGLMSVAYPQEQTQAFMQELQKLHHAVIQSDVQSYADDMDLPPLPLPLHFQKKDA